MNENDNHYIRLNLVQDGPNKELVFAVGNVMVFYAETDNANGKDNFKGERFYPIWREEVEWEYLDITEKDIESDRGVINRWLNLIVGDLCDRSCTVDYYLELLNKSADIDVELYGIAVLTAAVKVNEDGIEQE